MDSMIVLSVIIPTRNRAKYLSGALESLTRQTYPLDMFEVIVVDNGSTDNTREACASFENRIPRLQYIYEDAPGLHVGRHLGMKMAKSDILVYADDDIEAFPTWLEAIAESFQDPDVVLVGGKNMPRFESDPPDWIQKMWEKDQQGERILGYLSILDLGDEKKEIKPCNVYGCNFSIRKSVLLEAGGFHPDAMPQELIKYRGDGESHVSMYIQEKGYKTLSHPKASVYHLVNKSRMTVEYFEKRAYLQGISDSFTRIRESHGIQKHPVKVEKQITLKRIMNSLKRRFTSAVKPSVEDPYSEIKSLVREAYQEGYTYHQNEVHHSPQLLTWVLKEDYWDYQLPR